jgi:quaternary ammonium compound-resistance protein SugE
MAWVMLLIASGLEPVWTIALKESRGFSRMGPTVLFAVTSTLSLGLLAAALRDLPVGTGYAVWTGTGAVLTAVAGIIVLGEVAATARLVGIAVTVAGVVWLAVTG